MVQCLRKRETIFDLTEQLFGVGRDGLAAGHGSFLKGSILRGSPPLHDVGTPNHL
jgi:hypothetical protein